MSTPKVICSDCHIREVRHSIARESKELKGGAVMPARYDHKCDACWHSSDDYKQLQQKGIAS